MQNNTPNLVPVYKNGSQPWTPAAKTPGVPSYNQLSMGPRVTSHQNQHMMGAAPFGNRISPKGAGMPPNANLLMSQAQELGANMHKQPILPILSAADRVPRCPQGVAKAHTPPIHYGSPIQHHDAGVAATYNTPNFMVARPPMVNIGNRGHHDDVCSSRTLQNRNDSARSRALPMTPAMKAPAELLYASANTAVASEHLKKRKVQGDDPVGMMAYNQKVNANISHNAMTNIQSAPNHRVSTPQNIGQHRDIAAGRCLIPQGLEQSRPNIAQAKSRAPSHSVQHAISRVNEGSTFEQTHNSGALYRMPKATQDYKSIQGKPQVKECPTSPQQERVKNKQASDTASNTTQKATTTANKNIEYNKVVIQVAHKGNNPIGVKDGHLDQLASQSGTVAQTSSVCNANSAKVEHGSDKIVHPQVSNIHPPCVPNKGQRTFTLHTDWVLLHPEQMVYFEFGVSDAGYKRIVAYINSLMPPVRLRGVPNSNSTEIFRRNDLHIVTQDRPEISCDTASDSVVINTIEKLKRLGCGIIKKGELRKSLLRSYPEQNCIVRSGSEDYELDCFFGSTTIENNTRSSLYHKVKCDSNPSFVGGDETRNYNASVERQFDIYMEITGCRLQVLLRRIADIRKVTLHVAFGIRAQDVVDLILYLFGH
ncbi:uncharacterized protein BXIN_2246 [Babesia sp. Xinjiang]|uniref:uncharacterized protein n=1 Tax=Babesia sp. Xinjiang TaxID=462227 RepID=UPI000A254396|nr:uncharacterized protein BXIN_2246 [Babesia sp. Xinjiang]ORM40832.1 hypothetical protein BXIN_2246 [Babesia sp. Xinjiang]